MDSFSDPVDRQKIKDQFSIIEQLRDFIEYIFDTEITYMEQSEMMDRFEKHLENKHNDDTRTSKGDGV